MRKLTICTIVLLFILGITGCSEKTISIDIKDVKQNTLLARANGEIQVASIEDFNKSYYKMSELKDYVNQEVSSYNNKIGADKIKVNEIQTSNKKAVLLLTYSGMDQYAAFNKVTAAYFNGGDHKLPFTIPNTLVTASDQSLASTQEIITDESNKVLVLYEPYNILVDGKVKYYSENATLTKDNEVQGAADGMTIVVFK